MDRGAWWATLPGAAELHMTGWLNSNKVKLDVENLFLTASVGVGLDP